jgi:hypothetical protein
MHNHLTEKDKIKINNIIGLLADDEDLAKIVAKNIGEDNVDSFIEWLHNTEV